MSITIPVNMPFSSNVSMIAAILSSGDDGGGYDQRSLMVVKDRNQSLERRGSGGSHDLHVVLQISLMADGMGHLL